MNRTRTFTDTEFAMLWRDLGAPSLPRPLTFSSRTALRADTLRKQKYSREALRESAGPEIFETLADIQRPDIRLEVSGRDLRDPVASIRLLAARRMDRGYLITQVPCETHRCGGEFILTECDAIELADAVVNALPHQDAGRAADFVLARREPVASAVSNAFPSSIYERAVEFRAATALAGVVDVVQARSIYGARGTTRYRLGWRDLAGDGRYLISNGRPPVAGGADQRRLLSAINTRIAAIVGILRDEWIAGGRGGGIRPTVGRVCG